MKKISLCFLMVVCLIMQSICIVSADAFDQVDGSKFAITIQSESSNVDLSGITIDVYTAQVAFADVSVGHYEYDEEYSFSVVTGKNGKVTFERPSEYFSITVRMETLPKNYGIDNHTRFFTRDINEYIGNIYEISSVDIDDDAGEVVPILYGKNGNIIYAEASVEIIPKGNSKQVYRVDQDAKSISHINEINVSVYDNNYKYLKNVVYQYSNDVDKAGYLYTEGFISEQEYIESLSQYVLAATSNSVDTDSVDGTELYWKLRNYYEKCGSICTDNVVKALESFDNSISTKASTYVTSSDGHFRVYFDNSAITSAIAQSVANEFQAADALFCTSWGLRRPYLNTSTSYYKVNLVDTSAYAGQTPLEGTEGSYINISYTTARNIYNRTGISGYPDAYKGVVAHEYMHAIFYRYGIMYNTTERQWMHESFASWAGIAYKSDYSAFRTSAVKQFLSSTWKPLDYFTDGGTYGSRHYGSCVFPLYIQQQMGGYNTIKRILLSYSNSNAPFTAINTGLTYYGYSLASAYAGCASYNYNASYFYSNVPTSGYYAWGSGDIYEFSTYPQSSSVTSGVQDLACHYTQFNAPVNTNSTLTITVDYSGITGGANAVLKTVRKTESGNNYITNRTISNNRSTIVQYNFGYHIAKSITIVPINAATSGMVSYTRTASLVYTPADNIVYRLKNVGSGKYLNVHNGVDANTTNVYQWTMDGTIEQNFRLEEKNNGTYHIRAMCSSNGTNRVLDIVKSGGAVVSGCNVEIYTPVDPIAQEWKFYDMGSGRYKIVPASNTAVALTSYGSSNGSSGGQSPTSAGNVFVSTYTGSLNQLWVFEPTN